MAVPNEEKMSNLSLTSQSTCPHWGEGDSIFFNHFQSMDILGKIIYRSVSISKKISSIICKQKDVFMWLFPEKSTELQGVSVGDEF